MFIYHFFSYFFNLPLLKPIVINLSNLLAHWDIYASLIYMLKLSQFHFSRLIYHGDHFHLVLNVFVPNPLQYARTSISISSSQLLLFFKCASFLLVNTTTHSHTWFNNHFIKKNLFLCVLITHVLITQNIKCGPPFSYNLMCNIIINWIYLNTITKIKK